MVANKLMRGDTVPPVAHHRGEADVVEEVCGRTDPIHQKSVINNHVHHRQLWMGAPYGWVPVDTHSTPVPSSEGSHSNTAPNKMSPISDTFFQKFQKLKKASFPKLRAEFFSF